MFETWPKGFWITFENGFKVSVQWREGTYCHERGKTEAKASPNAEVAVYHPDRTVVPIDGGSDTVAGWVTPEEVATLLKLVSDLLGSKRFSSNDPLKFR